MQEPMNTYKPPLKKHPTKKPSRKVGRGGIGGALAVVVIGALEAYGIEVSATLAGGIGSLVVSVVAYLTRDRA